MIFAAIQHRQPQHAAHGKDQLPMRISTILDYVDNGYMALPEFQRGYVWNRDQVRRLMDSLYRRYPGGSRRSS